jgi:alpha-glucosidase
MVESPGDVVIFMRQMRTFLLLLAVMGVATGQSVYSLRSPSQKIEVKIQTGSRILYDVLVNGKLLLHDSTLSLTVDQKLLGRDAKGKTTKERSSDQVLEPVVRQKSATIREHYNELRIETDDNFAVVFRAYDEGVAYRLETSLQRDKVTVYSEEAAFNFAGDYTV